MASELAQKKCVPCASGEPPLKGADIARLRGEIGEGWHVVDEHHLEKEYRFTNFRDALAFTNRVGAIAEEEGHHPDIYLAWGKVRLVIWTHKAGGLTENDFILAARADAAL
ncbi:MAG: 4a-hydroxytetrahydrobiopterin dehydratase [Chthonomonadales bacterium]|nr:4a-hydroxytetrahydrobiopterin dehydratase [Chthonomonadales bacterium]